jgi:hypothetical protein
MQSDLYHLAQRIIVIFGPGIMKNQGCSQLDRPTV